MLQRRTCPKIPTECMTPPFIPLLTLLLLVTAPCAAQVDLTNRPLAPKHAESTEYRKNLPARSVQEIETIEGFIKTESIEIGMETTEITLDNKTVPIRDILSIRYADQQKEAQPRDRIQLRDQSRWYGKLLLTPETDRDTIDWVTPSLNQPLNVSLDDLLLYATTSAPPNPFPAPDPDSDQLLTREGALLSGILEELQTDGILFDDPSLGPLVIPWPKVLAFRLVEVPVDQQATNTGVLPIQIRTLDQSDVRAQLIQLDDQKIRWVDSTGQEKQIPLSRVEKIVFDLGRVIPLAQRDPISVVEGAPTTTWFPWTWKKDLNVLGAPLQIGGTIYEKGLGVHSRSELTFTVEPGDQFLTGISGMDISCRPPDEREKIGCAEFRILLDDEEAWSGGVLCWNDPGVPFRLPLQGASSFTLIVDIGPGHHILDRANWANIQIVRQ
ncbi:MAG: NPCBM/NEW2 domain-containing protein [Planctomycetota bacterium]